MIWKKGIHTIIVSSLLIFLLSNFSCSAYGYPSSISKPILWNVDNLDRLKEDTIGSIDFVKQICSICDKYATETPINVTSKRKSFTSDKHYYCSISIYYWPDSLNPKRYVRRDGYKNPETKDYDLQRLSEFVQRCRYLSVAYYLTNNERYYNAFMRQIKAWFIDKETYMYPSFRYSQVVPGADNNTGRASGLIETYEFNDVLESLRLVHTVKPIDHAVLSELQSWFLKLISSIDIDYGKSIGQQKNNIGLAYDVTRMNMYLFVGDENKAAKLFRQFTKKWLYRHILENGCQPLELKRASGFSYSVYNLTHILDFCFMAQYWNVDYYKLHQERIDMAFSFLEDYKISNQSLRQKNTREWERQLRNFYNQEMRRNRLRNHESKTLSLINTSIGELLQ